MIRSNFSFWKSISIQDLIGDDYGNTYNTLQASTNNIQKLDIDGNEVWRATVGSTPTSITTFNGKLYITSQGPNNFNVLDFDGLNLASFNAHEDFVFHGDVSYTGDIYTASIDYSVAKRDENYDLVWDHTINEYYGRKHLPDSLGNSYGLYEHEFSPFLSQILKFDTDGNVLYTIDNVSSTIADLALKRNGDFVICYGNTIANYTSSGDFLESVVLTGEGPRTLCVDDLGNIYAGFTNGKIRKYNSDLSSLLWTYDDNESVVSSVSVNMEYELFFSTEFKSGSPSVNPRVTKLSPSGVKVWDSNPTYPLAKINNVANHPGVVGSGSWSFLSPNPPPQPPPELAAHAVYTASADHTVKKLDLDGVEVWAFTGHSGLVWKVETDPYGFVYTTSFDNTLKKLDKDGNELWSYDAEYRARSLAVDLNGNSYITPTASFNSLRKVDPDGNLVWTVTGFSANKEACVVNQNFEIFTAGFDHVVHKFDEDGVEEWQYTGSSDSIRDLSVDHNGNCYVCNSDGNYRKIDSTGSQVWNSTVLSLAIISDTDDQNIVWGGDTTRRSRGFNQDTGSVSFSWAQSGAWAHGIGIDKDGFIYLSFHNSAVRKYTRTGSLVWQNSTHTDWVRGLCVGPGRYGAGFWDV